MTAKTLFEKVWEQHEVVPETADTPAVLYIDLHLVHEVTSPQAFSLLRAQGLKVRRTDRTLATMDHSTPTDPDEVFGRVPIKVESAARQVQGAREELPRVRRRAARPGQRSARHRARHRAGARRDAARQDDRLRRQPHRDARRVRRARLRHRHHRSRPCAGDAVPAAASAETLAIEVSGRLRAGVTAKDLILAIIGKIGVSGGTGHVIEYRGAAIEALSMDERMTVCNMSIEAGARAGMIAPDETTFAYLKGRRSHRRARPGTKPSPTGARCKTDAGARFDRVVALDANELEPMITYGTHPGMVVPITGNVPDAPTMPCMRKSLALHGLERRRTLVGKPIQVVFVGSCTNARLVGSAKLAARVFKGRKVAAVCAALVVPGSQQIKREAEAAGLDEDFHRCRRGMARVGLFDVHRHEWRHWSTRANTPSAPATATSKAARAPAHARARESGDGSSSGDHRPITDPREFLRN